MRTLARERQCRRHRNGSIPIHSGMNESAQARVSLRAPNGTPTLNVELRPASSPLIAGAVELSSGASLPATLWRRVGQRHGWNAPTLPANPGPISPPSQLAASNAQSLYYRVQEPVVPRLRAGPTRQEPAPGRENSGAFATCVRQIFPQPENQLQSAVSPDILSAAFGGMAMKRPAALALLTTVSPVALLIGSPADAADLARKAPIVAPPPPAYSWTGCYAGAHVGWGWGVNRYGESSTFSTSGVGSLDTSGALFGGQVGCNYQFAGWSPWSGSNWVIGVQGDFAGTDFNGKGADPLGDGDHLVSVKTEWLASVTGRLGLTAFNNQALFYVKGGGAWARNQWDISQLSPPFGEFDRGTFNETRSGWTIGGGAEWTLWSPNWTAFLEYNYYQLNGGTTVTGVHTPCPASSGGTCNQFNTGRQEIQTIKVGVNYKFTSW
jgi:outer membrane immunogenic protein